MPDKNKIKAMNDMGFEIQKVCGLCAHAEFISMCSSWGYCGISKYKHRKHNNPKEGRPMGIHRYGTCPFWERSELQVSINSLGQYVEFLESNNE